MGYEMNLRRRLHRHPHGQLLIVFTPNRKWVAVPARKPGGPGR